MPKEYTPKCAYKDRKGVRCEHKRDARGRFGPYCYWHRSYSVQYVKQGHDNSLLQSKNVRTLVENGTGKMYRRGKPVQDITAQLRPWESHASLLENGLLMSRGMSSRVAVATEKLDDVRDVNPGYVSSHAVERFDKLGSCLVRTGIRQEDMGIMRLQGLTVVPFSHDIEHRGVPKTFPLLQHDVIMVHDHDSRSGQDSVYVLDPSIAMFAPVDDPESDIDVRELPPEKTPYSDGVFVAPAGNYLYSPHMRWERFSSKWFAE